MGSTACIDCRGCLRYKKGPTLPLHSISDSSTTWPLPYKHTPSTVHDLALTDTLHICLLKLHLLLHLLRLSTTASAQTVYYCICSDCLLLHLVVYCSDCLLLHLVVCHLAAIVLSASGCLLLTCSVELRVHRADMLLGRLPEVAL
ncbi:hypothetical protein EDD86DRAFT_122898 [Gorgonomyces haynaldii]|nr:hypothetical protein EDD86DRAFT_122898 [Gorgonomyces haynaldii]